MRSDLPLFEAQIFSHAISKKLEEVINVGPDCIPKHVRSTYNGQRKMFQFGSYIYVEDIGTGGVAVFDRDTKDLILFIKNGITYDMRNDTIAAWIVKDDLES